MKKGKNTSKQIKLREFIITRPALKVILKRFLLVKENDHRGKHGNAGGNEEQWEGEHKSRPKACFTV